MVLFKRKGIDIVASPGLWGCETGEKAKALNEVDDALWSRPYDSVVLENEKAQAAS
jgi:hypothetical protein